MNIMVEGYGPNLIGGDWLSTTETGLEEIV